MGNVAKNLEKEHLGLLWWLSSGKNRPGDAGNTSSIPGREGSHMPRSN